MQTAHGSESAVRRRAARFLVAGFGVVLAKAALPQAQEARS